MFQDQRLPGPFLLARAYVGSLAIRALQDSVLAEKYVCFILVSML